MRAFLGGRGLPRDEFALIGAGGTADGSTPVVLLLEDGEVFTPEDYMSLGYTDFEAWCVGASGGRGGDATEILTWRITQTQETMPDDIWEDVLVAADRADAWRPGYLYVNEAWGWYAGIGGPALSDYHHREVIEGSGGVYRYYLTPRQNAQWNNFWHVGTVTHFHEMVPPDTAPWIGGGGGGGGLHVVAGRLDELPTSVAAEVGQKGADGAIGQARQPTSLVDPAYFWHPGEWYAFEGGRLDDGMNEARWNWAHRFPNGHPSIPPPGEGSPGGASSFGDICQASGGKGGKAAIHWPGTTPARQLLAHGGEGGVGGQTDPGGGADGAVSSSSGKDGSWSGSIGQGGGGGRGGVISHLSRMISNYYGYIYAGTVAAIQATQGGRGSLNYGDTSVWGARGPLGTYSQVVRAPAPYTQWNYKYNAIISETPWSATVESLIPKSANPGSGGGARIPGNRKYGSQAPGYNHDGAVLLRLFKLD